MKRTKNLNESELAAEGARCLLGVLGRVPFVSVSQIDSFCSMAGSYVDVVASLSIGERKPWTLACEVKNDTRPSVIRTGVLSLHAFRERSPNTRIYPLIIAPFMSEQARQICAEYDVGYLDLAGNCRICVDHVFIELSGHARQPSPKQLFKALFGKSSSRLLRLMLRDPRRHWKVRDLAMTANVSAGLASNVRRALIDQEWAISAEDGLRLTKPSNLLDAWREDYAKQKIRQDGYYTILHDSALKEAIQKTQEECDQGQHLLLAGASAAQWIAPYLRGGINQFYADKIGLASLRRNLQLEETDRGANVVVFQPKDEGVFLDRLSPVEGIWCTSPVQTYLDLSIAGERNAEAADHLRREVLLPTWKDLS